MTTNTNDLVDRPFNSIIEYVAVNKSTVHNSIDLYSKYVQELGSVLSRRQLTKGVKEKFKDDMIVLSSPGIATMFSI